MRQTGSIAAQNPGILGSLQGEVSLRSRRRDRAAAVGIAVAVHLVFLLGIVAAGSGTLIKGAQARLGEGDSVEVMLSGWEGAAARARKGVDQPATAESRLNDLMERLRAVNSPLYVTPQKTSPPAGGLASLFDAPATADGKGKQGEGAGAAGRRDDGGDRADTALSSRVGDAASGNSSAGGLWSQIEPCWNRLPMRSAMPVTLEISLSGDGRLAKPPRILRPDIRRPEEDRLVAEARALQAISACLPYGGAQGLGRTQQVVFPSSRSR